MGGREDVQHSVAAHLALPFWGPQFPARAPDTNDKKARVATRIMTSNYTETSLYKWPNP